MRAGKDLAKRAYHIDEVRAPGALLEVDAAYYLANQVSQKHSLDISGFIIMSPTRCCPESLLVSHGRETCSTGCSRVCQP